MESPTTPARIEQLLAHREWVRRLARSLVLDDSRAADLEQEVWLSALERPPRDLRTPRGWLATALRHAASNFRRSEGRRARREEEAARPEMAPAAVDLVAEAESQRRVVDAVLRLEEPYRSAVLLRWFEDLPPEEIARRQGVPVETARTRLKRALGRLREHFDRESRGDRRSWVVALLPLARRAEAPAVPATAIAGGLLMTVKSKAALAAVAVAFLAFLGWLALGEDGAEPAAPSPGRQTAAAPTPAVTSKTVPPAAVVPAPAPAPAAAAAVPPPVEHRVRGTVLDENGRAVVGAMVLVGAAEDPFEGMSGLQVIKRIGARDGEKLVSLKGAVVPVDGEGRFEARFSGPKRIYVAVAPGVPGIRESGPGRWVETPTEGVELRAVIHPTGTFVIRLVDQATGKPVAGFGVSLQGKGRDYGQARTLGTSIEHVVELSPGFSEETVQVKMIEPVELAREVVLKAGGRVEVEFSWKPSAEARGRVLSAGGTPVEGALVFLGEPELARGDEPFKPFDEKRVPQAVRTSASGEFSVRGDGVVVTVWHKDHSPVTVPVDAASEIRLPARGSIRGRLVDATGGPLAGVEIALDRTRKSATDADGRFAFDAVEAGVRGLLLPGRRYICVRVAPGGTEEIEIGPGLPEVRVEVRSAGKPLEEPLRGVLVGLGRVAGMHEVKTADGVCTISGALPGEHLLLTDTGHLARVEVTGATATVDLGTATLTVRGPPGASVCLAPSESDSLVDLLAMRVGHRAIPPGGTLTFPGLADGAYRVLTESPPGSGRKSAETPASIQGGRDGMVDLRAEK